MAPVYTIICRSASRVAPFSARFIGGQRHYHYRHSSALFSAAAAVKQTHLSRKLILPTFFSSVRHCSSSVKRPSSDDSLLKVIESEIICAEESPEGFPFKIEDNLGQQTISLTREYPHATINVEVHMPDLVTDEEVNENDNDDDNKKAKYSIPLVVRVTRDWGYILEFSCTAYLDEISIDSLSVKERKSCEDQIAIDGPDFSDLDENLQKAFHMYLEVRGIKPSTTSFIHHYMINKANREYSAWLKNIKNFIQA